MRLIPCRDENEGINYFPVCSDILSDFFRATYQKKTFLSIH